MFPRNSLTPLVREQTILSSPLSSPSLGFSCVRARVDVARPRCEAAEITGSLLRPPAANPKEANAMSSGEQTLAPDKQRRTVESRRILRTEASGGGGIYIGGTGGEGGRRRKEEGRRKRGRVMENKKLPITPDRNPYTDPLYPILVVILFDCSRVCFFGGGGGTRGFED